MRIQKEPFGPLVAVHRLYIAKDEKVKGGARKARVDNPKKVLASSQGAGIWLGEPKAELYIVEGPENALNLLSCGSYFVVCAISANNMASLTIPDYVHTVKIVRDRDDAGEAAIKKAAAVYISQGLEVLEARITDYE